MKGVGWRLSLETITELRTPCEKFLATPLRAHPIPQILLPLPRYYRLLQYRYRSLPWFCPRLPRYTVMEKSVNPRLPRIYRFLHYRVTLYVPDNV